MNVLLLKKSYKASVLYIIKNNLTFKIEYGYNTRQIFNIKVLTMHKKLTQSTYLYIGPKFYNILPFEIKSSNFVNLSRFLKKTYILVTMRTTFRHTTNL